MNNLHWPEIFSCFKEIEQNKTFLFGKRGSVEALLHFRASLINSLQSLKESLLQNLSEQTTNDILFALAAFLDEDVHLFLSKEHKAPEWSSLQQELYSTSHAGELFYKHLDNILDDPLSPAILVEFYYFILNKGFRGKYVKSPNKIAKYMDFLMEKMITPSLPPPREKTEKKEKEEILISFKTWHYYALTSCLIILLYSIFYFESLTL